MGSLGAMNFGVTSLAAPNWSWLLRSPRFLARFAADSPQEGDGFEPSVPGTKEPGFVAEGELRDRTRAAKKGCFLCGTDGSNPSPSSRESPTNRDRVVCGPIMFAAG